MAKTASFYRDAEALERVRIKLAEAGCEEMVQGCLPSSNGDFRYCCAAKEICEPSGGSPLNFVEFSSTLKHFKAGGLFKRRAGDAHRAYLLRSCIAEVSPKMEELDTEIVRLDEELDAVLENGGEGRAELMSAINDAAREVEKLQSAAAEKAKRLAVAKWEAFCDSGFQCHLSFGRPPPTRQEQADQEILC